MIIHMKEEVKLQELLEGPKYLGIITEIDLDTIKFEIFNFCSGETLSVASHQRRKLAQLCSSAWEGKPFEWEELGIHRLLDVAKLAMNKIVFLEFGYGFGGREFDLQTISSRGV